jgi:hypothetical protein
MCGVLVAVFLCRSIAAVGQTQPDWAGSNVILRDNPGAGPEGDYDLITIKDGRVLHTERIGEIRFYAKSHDRLVVFGHDKLDTRIRVFGLPQGNAMGTSTLPKLFCPALQQGAAEWAIVDADFAYFTGLLDQQCELVKINIVTGTVVMMPPPDRGAVSSLTRAGEYLFGPSNRLFSISKDAFDKPTPPYRPTRPPYTGRRGVVFVPADGLYTWNSLGDLTRVATESLDPIAEADRKPISIARGIFGAVNPGTPAADKMVVALTGPKFYGDGKDASRNEPPDYALTVAKPSERSIVGIIKFNFTPTTEIFRTAQDNVVAVVDQSDGSVVKFDCLTSSEVERIVLPPVAGRVSADRIEVVY